MRKAALIVLTALACWYGVSASPVLAASVVVSQLGTGDILLVDDSQPTLIAAGLDRPAMVKLDRHGNLFVFEFIADFSADPRVSKIDPSGGVTTFADGLPRIIPYGYVSYLDLTISDDDRVFVLVRLYSFLREDPRLTEIWELSEGAPPSVITSLAANTYRFTFGPGGYFYLAANGHDYSAPPSEYNDLNNHILRVSRAGRDTSFYEFPLPNLHHDRLNGANLMSVRFDSNGDMFLLAQTSEGPNYREVWKVQDGDAFLFAKLGNNPGSGRDGALTVTIDDEDNLFFVGGGSQCSPCTDGFIQKLDPSGQLSTLALFPNASLNAMFYVDDKDFDLYPLSAQQILGTVDEAVESIVSADPPGGFGLIHKLTEPPDGVGPKVDAAQTAFDAGDIGVFEYVALLEEALDKLDAFDNQLDAKIRNGQIEEPEASDLVAASTEIRILIELMIDRATG